MTQPANGFDQHSEEDGFFSGGGDGVPSAKFRVTPGISKETELGGIISGTVVSTRMMDQTIMGSNPPAPIIDEKTGKPKRQMRVVLQTNLRNWDKCSKQPVDPEDNPRDPSEDDGKRAIYVKGWMTGAIADALRAAGANGLRPGGKLAVKVTELVPTTKGNPYAKYKALYEAPDPGDNMFEQAAQGAPAPDFAQPQQAAPAVAPQPAPVQQAPVAPQPVQAAPAPQQAPAPQPAAAPAPAPQAAPSEQWDEPPF